MTEFLSKLPENTIKNTNQQDSSPMSVVLPSAPIPLLCLWNQPSEPTLIKNEIPVTWYVCTDPIDCC